MGQRHISNEGLHYLSAVKYYGLELEEGEDAQNCPFCKKGNVKGLYKFHSKDCKNNNEFIILAHDQMVNYLIHKIPKKFKAKPCNALQGNRPEGRKPDIEIILPSTRRVAYIDVGISNDMFKYYKHKEK